MADHPSIGLGIGVGGAINTDSAVPLPDGTWAVGLNVEYVEFDAFSDGQLHEFDERDPDGDVHSVDSLLNVALSASYGVTGNLTVGARLPYVRRKNIREAGHGHDGAGQSAEHDEHDEHGDAEDADGVEVLGDSEGIGDAVVFGQYRFLYDRRTNSHAAVLFGVKTPTGSTDEKSNDGGRLETEFQPGSGSWDGLLGMAYTRQLGAVAFGANVLYQLATEGSQDTDLGDVFEYNAAIAYRRGANAEHGHDHSTRQHHAHNVWDYVLELNGSWRDKEHTAGVENPNSGGNIVFLSPGVRFFRDNGWGGSLSLGIPVVTDLNGIQVEPDYRLTATVGKSF